MERAGICPSKDERQGDEGAIPGDEKNRRQGDVTLRKKDVAEHDGKDSACEEGNVLALPTDADRFPSRG